MRMFSCRIGLSGLVGLALAVLFSVGEMAQAQTRSPGQVFRDCSDVCPEMVVVPPGSLAMATWTPEEGPVTKTVTFARPFAVGRFEITFAEWDACVAEDGCPRWVAVQAIGQIWNREFPAYDEGRGRGRQPVINVSWNDAQGYLRWLSTRTGQPYRLLSESEWEYAARAGTTTLYSTGDSITAADANFSGTGRSGPVPVGTFAPNAFGLHDMHGNVFEWVQDCFYDTPIIPSDGSAWSTEDCDLRSLRGGSWFLGADVARSAHRARLHPDSRHATSLGFRVARTL